MRLCLEIDGIWRIGLPVLSFAAKESKRVSYYVERGSAIIDTMNYKILLIVARNYYQIT